MKILYVIPALSNGGIEKMVENWISQAISKGHKCDILAFNRGDNLSFSKMGCSIYECDVKSIHLISSKIKLNRFFSEHKDYDVVHSNVGFLGGMVSCEAKKICPSNKTVCHAHLNGRNSYSSFVSRIINESVQKRYSYLIKRYSDMNLACSYQSGDYLFGSRDNYVFFPNAIDTVKFRFNSQDRFNYRRDFGIPESDIIIIHVGRFSREKNHKFLLSVFESIAQHKRNVHLVLVGDGEGKNELENACSRNMLLKDRVHFLGFRMDVAQLFSMADIFVLPSLIEGFPVSVVEAQCNGLSCVVSDATPEEAVLTNSTIRLSLDKGIEEWATIISDLDVNIERNKQEEVVSNRGFSMSDSANTLMNYYKVN